MKKIFTNGLLSAIFALFSLSAVFAQTIKVGAVDPGPYGQGSTISVPITVSGSCVGTGTTYNLYLSDANGNFSSPTLIGTFSNFYAPFVNGVVPAGTPAGSGYKVEVISSNPSITSTVSAAFTINAGQGVTAGVSSQAISPNYTDVFGVCNGSGNTPYSFVDQSTAGSTVTATFFNELSQSSEGTITPTASGATFTANAAQYMVTVKAVNGGIVGTKSYLLINNTVNNSFGVTGNNAVCLKNGTATLTYNVDITSANGIQNNFPGLIYTISWGDKSVTLFTLCDIIAAGGKISHTYTSSSCGSNPNGQNNAFEVDLQPSDLYCGKVGTQVTSYAQVITAPVNQIASPVAACLDSTVNFANTSDPGQNPNNTQQSCVSLNALYTWSVDGVVVASNYGLGQPLKYKFHTTGTHSVTIHLQNGSSTCNAEDVTVTICVQNPPKPKFTLPVTTGCVPFTVTPVNQSTIDANCSASNQYIWNVTGPGPVAYANGTNASSVQPQFVFKNSGIYQIQLGITTASCGTIEAPVQTIYVDSATVAKLSNDTTICGTNQTFSFSTKKGATQTFLSGNVVNFPGAYKWTVTGGNYTFKGGTSDTSKYPQIKFTDLASYTITVTNTNLCSPPATATQHISFLPSPTVDAGNDTTFCANIPLPLKGVVNGSVNSTQWMGGTGIFTPGRNVVNPTYTPSAAEIATGSVTLTLVATTSLAPPCNMVTSSVNLTITKPDSITSAAIVSTCSNTPINYQITSVRSNSTFSWTVDQTKTSASASGYKTTGSGTTINDVVTNSDPNNDAIVTYNIVAAGTNGCNSNTFVLTVNVSPKQSVAKFTQDFTSGCDSLKVQFTNQSTPPTSVYMWNFGDGTPPTNVANPSHKFAPRLDGKDTTYTVTLNIISNCGNTIPATSTVTVHPKTPVAFITPEKVLGCSPFTLIVDNYSPGNNQSYTYYLYDGSTLVQQITVPNKNKVQFNPVTVKGSKQYTLYMVATGLCGNTGQSNIIPITISPTNIIAQTFPADGRYTGCAPYTTSFINNSEGGDTYYYTIYDVNKKVIDLQQGGTAPFSYTFGTAGTFYVTVTGVNGCTTNTSDTSKYTIYPSPTPQFTADVTTGCKTVVVNFQNTTPDLPLTKASSFIYSWDFGDGSPKSPGFNPAPHQYNYINSPYTVTLTATNPSTNCVSSITKTGFIVVTPPPSTAFTEKPDSVTNVPNYRFNFIDKSTNSPKTWLWNFGDGQTSTFQNPGHTYLDTGLFKVTLTTQNTQGCDSTVSHYVRINGVPGQLFLPNAFEPGGGTIELKTFMAKGSGMKSWHLQIFNNYSELIWETTKLDAKGAPVEGWDGTFQGVQLPQGVYIWQASASFINGTEWKGNVIDNSPPKRTGVIHLIR